MKDVVLNISLYDLLCGFPKYGKFIKDMLSNKREEKLDDIVTLSKFCSCIIQKKLVVLKNKGDLGTLDIGDSRMLYVIWDPGSA